MITINSLEELDKYLYQTIPKSKDKRFKVKLYRFTENEELANVVFNIEIPFGLMDFQTPKTVKVRKRKSDNALPNVDFAEPVCYSFWANDIVANKKFRVGRLYANNVSLNDDSEIYDELRAKGKVKATKLDCEMVAVLCEEMECEDLIVQEIICGKLKAKILITHHNNFENITAENVNKYYEIMKSD